MRKTVNILQVVWNSFINSALIKENSIQAGTRPAQAEMLSFGPRLRTLRSPVILFRPKLIILWHTDKQNHTLSVIYRCAYLLHQFGFFFYFGVNFYLVIFVFTKIQKVFRIILFQITSLKFMANFLRIPKKRQTENWTVDTIKFIFNYISYNAVNQIHT